MVKPIVVKITGDADHLDRTTRDVDGMFNRLDRGAKDTADGIDGSFSRMGGSALKFGGLMAGALVVGGGAALMSLNSLGTELDIFDKKVTTVFEGSADTVRKWADANNEAMGMSDEKLAGLAASFGDLLKPMGFTAEQAATMSTEVVGLSGALSAWSGGTIKAAEVSDILAKAMLGEADGLKALGISISADEVKMKALSMGLVQSSVDTVKLESSTLALMKAQERAEDAVTKYGAGSKEAAMATREMDLAQAKLNVIMEGAPDDVDAQSAAIATQALIMEKSTDAQKAWADGSMDAIKSQNSLKATIDDLKASIALKLQPAFQWMAGWLEAVGVPAVTAMGERLRDVLVPAFHTVSDWVTGTGVPALQDLGGYLAEHLSPAFNAVSDWVTSVGLPALKDFGGILRDQVGPAIQDAGKWVVETMLPAMVDLGQWVIEHKPVLIGLAAAVGVGLTAAFASWAIAAGAAAIATIAATAPVIAIGLAIAALVAGVIYAYQNWGWFRTAVDAVASALTDKVWPAIKVVAEWLADKLGPAIGAVVDYYKWLFDIAMVVVGAFVEHVLPILRTVAGWLWDQLVPAVQAQIDVLQKLWDKAVPVFGAVRDAIGWVIEKMALNREGLDLMWGTAERVFGLVRDAVGWVVNKVGVMVGVFKDLPGQIESAVSGLADTIVAPFRDAFNQVTRLWDNTVGKLPIPGGIDIPFVGRAHGGPVTTGRPYLVGEQGPEMIVPNQSGTVLNNQQTGQALNGGGGTTININSPIGRPEDVVAWMREQLRRSERARR